MATAHESRILDFFAIQPTLFSDDGEAIDEWAMRAAAEMISSYGIRDVLLTGSYGEFQSLSDAERVAAVRAVRSVPSIRRIMACAASPSSTATAGLCARLVDAGADLVMVSAPLVAEVDEAAILRHFEYVSRLGTSKTVVYNNPVFGIDLPPDLIGKISSLTGVWGVKQGTRTMAGLVDSISATRRAAGERVKVLVASDTVAHLGLFAGADGLTSTNSWIFPRTIKAVVEAAGRGEWKVVQLLCHALEPYFSEVRALGQPRAVKAAMVVRGYPIDPAVRLPYTPLDDPEVARLRDAIKRCDDALDRFGHREPFGS